LRLGMDSPSGRQAPVRLIGSMSTRKPADIIKIHGVASGIRRSN
jgi:hypothetical protein